VFDYAVNSGPSRSMKALQRIVKTKVDGLYGPMTHGALRGTSLNAKALIQKHCNSRLGFVRGLSTWDVFGKGWGRRIGRIRAQGLQMANVSRQQIERDRDNADKLSKDQGKGAGAAVGGGTGAVIVDQSTSDIGIWVIVIVVVCITVAAIWYVKSRAHRRMVEGMDEVLKPE